MIAAQTGVCLSRILNRLKVVGHRDNREQNQQEYRQGDELHAPIKTSLVRDGLRGKSEPKTKHQRGNQHPCEIENQFHALSRFYN